MKAETMMTTDAGGSSLAADLALTLAATHEAGRVAMSFFRTAHERWEKGPGQIVTEADIAIDRLLKERLLGARPGYGWLSEETEDDPARLQRRMVWVVDPIDGTRSFAEGTPEFTISVALVEDGLAVVGIVLNPATDELFLAARGQGATLNGGDGRATAQGSLEGARIVASRFESRRRRFGELLPAVELDRHRLARLQAGARRGRPVRRLSLLAAHARLGHRGRCGSAGRGRGPVHRRRWRPDRAQPRAAGA